jgi:ketosteroid isomerase-like protein
MSEKNVEIVRALYEATSGGKMDAQFELLAPEVEFRLSGAFPDLDPVYRGHAEIRRLNEQLNAPWEELSFLPDRIIDLGDRVLALCHFHAKGRDGLEVDFALAHIWTIRDGQAVSLQAYSDQKEALEAAGVER